MCKLSHNNRCRVNASEALGSTFFVRRSACLVLRAWCGVLGAGCLVRGAWCGVLGSKEKEGLTAEERKRGTNRRGLRGAQRKTRGRIYHRDLETRRGDVPRGLWLCPTHSASGEFFLGCSLCDLCVQICSAFFVLGSACFVRRSGFGVLGSACLVQT
jgi:hypothetical protein